MPTNAVRSDTNITFVDIYPVLENILHACVAKSQILLRGQYLEK
jgi:hypothetical protein